MSPPIHPVLWYREISQDQWYFETRALIWCRIIALLRKTKKAREKRGIKLTSSATNPNEQSTILEFVEAQMGKKIEQVNERFDRVSNISYCWPIKIVDLHFLSNLRGEIYYVARNLFVYGINLEVRYTFEVQRTSEKGGIPCSSSSEELPPFSKDGIVNCSAIEEW